MRDNRDKKKAGVRPAGTNDPPDRRKGEHIAMRNIVLVCNMGMSTSLMVNKIRAAAKADGYACEINAYALQKAAKEIEAADIILVGPQLSFELPKLKSRFPEKIIMAINMQDYGRMDGAKVLATVKQTLGD